MTVDMIAEQWPDEETGAKVLVKVSREVLDAMLASTVQGLTFGQVVDRLPSAPWVLVEVDDADAPASWVGRLVDYEVQAHYGAAGATVRLTVQSRTLDLRHQTPDGWPL